MKKIFTLTLVLISLSFCSPPNIVLNTGYVMMATCTAKIKGDRVGGKITYIGSNGKPITRKILDKSPMDIDTKQFTEIHKRTHGNKDHNAVISMHSGLSQMANILLIRMRFSQDEYRLSLHEE